MGSPTKYIALTILFLWMLFGLFVAVVQNFFQQPYTNWLLAAPVFFSIFAAISFKKVVLNPAVKVTALMASKTIRLLLTMVVILLYIVLIKENSVVFVVNFGIFFVVYLVLETLIMVRTNRLKKKH